MSELFKLHQFAAVTLPERNAVSTIINAQSVVPYRPAVNGYYLAYQNDIPNRLYRYRHRGNILKEEFDDLQFQLQTFSLLQGKSGVLTRIGLDLIGGDQCTAVMTRFTHQISYQDPYQVAICQFEFMAKDDWL